MEEERQFNMKAYSPFTRRVPQHVCDRTRLDAVVIAPTPLSLERFSHLSSFFFFSGAYFSMLQEAVLAWCRSRTHWLQARASGATFRRLTLMRSSAPPCGTELLLSSLCLIFCSSNSMPLSHISDHSRGVGTSSHDSCLILYNFVSLLCSERCSALLFR